MPSWSRIRPRWPSLAVALLVSLPLLPALLGQSLWLRDTMVFTYPLKAYVRERLLRGELPLWNPLMGLGRPVLGMVQPGVLYPGNLVLLLPLPLGLDLFFLLHLPLGALGMRCWLRALALAELPASLGGVLFALSGYLLSMTGSNGFYLVGVAWVPWILAAAARLAAGKGTRSLLRRAALLSLLILMGLLAGDPQAVFFAALLCGVQLLCQGPPRGRVLLGLVLAGTLAVACGLIQVLPGLETASVGRPGGVPVSEAGHFSLHPARLLEFLWPGAFGPPHSGRWFVQALYDEGSGERYEPFAAGIYCGLAVPLLAVLAGLSRRRTAMDLGLSLAALAALFLALGRHLPFWEPFFRFFPGARLFRYPEKYVCLFTLCIIPLMARGLGVVLSRPSRAMRVALGLLLLFGAAAALGGALGGPLMQRLVGRLGEVSVNEAGQLVRAAAVRSLLLALLFWLVLLLGARGTLRPARIGPALAAVMVLDVLSANLGLLQWTDSDVYRLEPKVVADLRALGGPGPYRLYRPRGIHISLGGDRPEVLRATLAPDCGMEAGIDHLNEYDNFYSPGERLIWTRLQQHPLRLLQVFGAPFTLLNQAQVGRGLLVRRRYPNLGTVLCEVAGVAPRVYLARDAREVPDQEAAVEALAAPGFAPGQSAVVEGGAPRAAAGQCELVRYGPERISILCETDAQAYAVLGDAFYPGWEAVVNGTPVPILRANALLRAVPVPAGDSAVELRYRPRSVRAGVLGSILGLLLCAGCLLL